MGKATKTIKRRNRMAQAISYQDRMKENLGRLILRAIDSEFKNVDYFTREDLLQVRALQDVATITRYRNVCEAVHWLMLTGRLVSRNRTELVVAEKAHRRKLVEAPPAHQIYGFELEHLVTEFFTRNPGIQFTVMDIVTLWDERSDLTYNVKRAAVRRHLRNMKRRQLLDFNEETRLYREAK